MSKKNFKNVLDDADVKSELVFIRPSQIEKPGVLVEGEFLETIQNRYDDTVVDYKFQDDEGNLIIINHAGHLAFLMKKVNPGDYCRVSYNGKTDYKGRNSHSFKVETAE